MQIIITIKKKINNLLKNHAYYVEVKADQIIKTLYGSVENFERENIGSTSTDVFKFSKLANSKQYQMILFNDEHKHKKEIYKDVYREKKIYLYHFVNEKKDFIYIFFFNHNG